MKRLRERVRCSSLVDWPVYPRVIRDYVGGLAVAEVSDDAGRAVVRLFQRGIRQRTRYSDETLARKYHAIMADVNKGRLRRRAPTARAVSFLGGEDDDLAVEVATLEQLLDAHQLAHAHPSGSSADIIAGQILPFAPEPFIASDLHRLLPADLPAHNPLSSTRNPRQPA